MSQIEFSFGRLPQIGGSFSFENTDMMFSKRRTGNAQARRRTTTHSRANTQGPEDPLRRKILLGLIGAGVLGVGAGGWELLKPKEEETGGTSEISEQYPELLGFSLKEQKSIKTSYNSVRLYNFTEFQTDYAAAFDLYSYVESFAQKPWMGSYQLPTGDTTSWVCLLRKSVGISVFIVPSEAPNPKWAPNDALATTFLPFDHTKRLLTKVRAPELNKLDPQDSLLFDTVEKQLNLYLNIEAVQAVIDVGVSIGVALGSMQEIVANSFGKFLTSRQYDVPYNKYKEFTETVGHGFFGAGVVGKFLDPGPELYSQIPQLKRVFRNS